MFVDIFNTNKKYKIIYADPPWRFKVWSRKTGLERSAESHYQTMEKEDIQNLPVKNICDQDCVLFLWVTAPCLKEGLELVENGVLNIKLLALHGLRKIKSLIVCFGAWVIIQGQTLKSVY